MTLLREMIRFQLQRPLGAALCVIAVTLGLTAILGAAAPLVHTERDLYTADELARIYRRSPLGPLPPGPVDGVAESAAAGCISSILSPPTRRSARRTNGSSGSCRRSPTLRAFRRMRAPIPIRDPR